MCLRHELTHVKRFGNCGALGLREADMGHLFIATLVTAFLFVSFDGRNTPPDRVEHKIGGDYFTAGRSITITNPTPGDVVAAGRTVDLNTDVGGDAVLAGATVHVIAAIVLFVTVIGIPLGLLVVAGYLALILVGYVSTSVAIADWALTKFKPAWESSAAWRSASAAAAVLLIALLTSIPWLGGLIIFIAIVMGSGAILMQLIKPMPHVAA